MPDGCHVVFDFETYDEELIEFTEVSDMTDPLGDKVNFDEDFAEDIPTLLAGGEIGIRESHGTFGWLLTKYELIRDSSGNCVAYVGVDVSMIGVEDYNRRFIIWNGLLSLLFLAILADIGYHFYSQMRKSREYEESEHRMKQQHILFEQTADALSGAIDAKAPYTNGHSHRADDGKVFGENYRDYMLVRLDGECWEGNPSCIVTDSNSRSSDFGGVSVKATAEITDGNKVIYAAITGDQVAITNIRIKKQTN